MGAQINTNMIIDFILFLLTFLVGYYLGTKRNPKQDLSTINTSILNEIKKRVPKEELKVGPIRRPTYQEINNSKIPEKEKEGIKAMEETLKDIPELNV